MGREIEDLCMAGERSDVSKGDSSDGQGGRPEHGNDAERLRDLRAILTKTKVTLLQQMLASPTGALSAVELAARSEITESTIRDHLRDLTQRERPIVEVLEAETDDPVPNGIPRKYYAVSEYGIELLKQVGLYEQIGIIYDMYEAADLSVPADRPRDIEEIEGYEHRPTPEWL